MSLPHSPQGCESCAGATMQCTPAHMQEAHAYGKDIWVDVHACVQGTNSAKVMGSSDKGMVLPFQPLSLTFHHMDYYVKLPKVLAASWPCQARLQELLHAMSSGLPGQGCVKIQRPYLKAAPLLASSALCAQEAQRAVWHMQELSSRSYIGCL